MGLLEDIGSASKYAITQAWNKTLTPWWIFTDKSTPTGHDDKTFENPVYNVVHDTPVGRVFDAVSFLTKYGVYIAVGIIIIIIFYKMEKR